MTLDEAKAILKDADVYLDDPYFHLGDEDRATITIDGNLNVMQIEALLVYMEALVAEAKEKNA